MAVIQGGVSTNLADVNANNELKAALTLVSGDAGFVNIQDSVGNTITTTENGALNVSTDEVILWEQVDGSALNTNIWTTSASTMTVAQANGFIVLNSASSIATGAYAILQTNRYIPLYGPLPLRVLFNDKVSVQPQANATIELGIGLASGTSAPTDGIFFRWNSSTQFIAVVNNGGSETYSSALTAPTSNIVHLYQIIVVEDRAEFYIDDVLVAEILVPAGLAYPTNNGRLPLFARTYNGGSSPAFAPTISIGQVIVAQQAMNQNKTWEDILAAMGRGAYQSPVTAYGQTANHANSTSPVSASLSNTVAGYTTLGGRYQFAAVGSAVTDFALFAFQVPTGYQLVIKNLTITAMNIGAAVAVGPTILDWSIGVNNSAVSLATADGAGTWAPRRIPLGMQSFALLGAIGLSATDINRTFGVPLIVESGRYLHIIVQVPVGTATSSQVIRGDVMINGYFE